MCVCVCLRAGDRMDLTEPKERFMSRTQSVVTPDMCVSAVRVCVGCACVCVCVRVRVCVCVCVCVCVSASQSW